MPRIDWTPALISAAKKILRHSPDLPSALADVSRSVGCPVSLDTLAGALRRAGEPSPSTFLKPARVELSPRDELVKRVEAKQAARDRKAAGITALVLEKVEAALAKIEPDTIQVVKAPSVQVPDGPPEVIWAEVSDVQLGTKVDAEKVGGLNSHDWTVFLAKLAAWEAGIDTVIRERRTVRPIEGVVIALLGDIVEGHDIFRGQAYELDLDAYKQVTLGARDFAQAFARLAARYPEIPFTLYGVAGNHGRIGSKGEAPFRVNLDLFVYHIIELRLAALRLPNVACHFPESWFQVVQTWEWTNLLVHGEDIKGWGGLPFYGLQRAVAKYGQVLQRPINYLHAAHHHAEAAISSSLGDALINGNWIGANAFSKVIVEANTPVQMVHGITEANGIEWSRKIPLRTRQEMRPRVTVYRHGKRSRAA